MQQVNKIRLGAFILLAAAMIITSFFAVGIRVLFEPKIHAMTVMNTSVEGLSVGSPVKYLGVPVGKVTRISMRDSDCCIDVYFQVFSSSIDIINNGPPTPSSDAGIVCNMLQKRNLCCFINASGIMGGTYLALAAADPGDYAMPNLKVVTRDGIIYIPAKTSHISSAIENISKMLEQLTEINFVKVFAKIDHTLDTADKTMGNPEIGQLVSRLNNFTADLETSSASFRKTFTPERMDKLMRAVDEIEAGAKMFNASARQGKIARLSDEMNSFLTESRQFFKTSEQAMYRFNKTLEQMEAFINSLEDDPNQIIWGKQERPVFAPPPK